MAGPNSSSSSSSRGRIQVLSRAFGENLADLRAEAEPSRLHWTLLPLILRVRYEDSHDLADRWRRARSDSNRAGECAARSRYGDARVPRSSPRRTRAELQPEGHADSAHP